MATEKNHPREIPTQPDPNHTQPIKDKNTKPGEDNPVNPQDDEVFN